SAAMARTHSKSQISHATEMLRGLWSGNAASCGGKTVSRVAGSLGMLSFASLGLCENPSGKVAATTRTHLRPVFDLHLTVGTMNRLPLRRDGETERLPGARRCSPRT